MPDAEHPPRQLAQPRAEGGVEAVQDDLPHPVGVLPAGKQRGGERAGVFRRIPAHDLQAPGPDRAAGCLGVPLVPGEDRGKPFLGDHGEALPQPVEQVRRRCVRKHPSVRGVEQWLPRPVTPRQARIA